MESGTHCLVARVSLLPVPETTIIARCPVLVTGRLMRTWDTAFKVSFTGKVREVEVIRLFKEKEHNNCVTQGMRMSLRSCTIYISKGLQEHERKNRLYVDLLHRPKRVQGGYPALGTCELL